MGIALTTTFLSMGGPAHTQEKKASSEQRAVVEAARQVTGYLLPARAFVGPAVAVHPQDERIVAIAAGEAYGSKCGLEVSFDNALSWTSATSPQPDAFEQCVYSQLGPVTDLAFTPDGTTLYYAFAARKFPDWRMKVFLGRSRDLGKTWQTVMVTPSDPDLAEGDVGSYALPSVVVDSNRSGRVYVTWQRNYNLWYHDERALPEDTSWEEAPYVIRPYLAVSNDGGRTFSDPVDLSAGMGAPSGIAGVKFGFTAPQAVVGDDGTIFAFFGEYSASPEGQGDEYQHPDVHLWLTTSEDGGATFTAPEPVATRPSSPGLGWLSDPRPAMDPRSGDLYVVFEDMPKDQPQGVMFLRSSDRGATWSEPVRVNEFAPPWGTGWNAFLPWMDVAEHGRIDVAWYDYRNDPTGVEEYPSDGGLQDVYYTYSTDGGRTWARNVRVTDRMMDRRFGVWEGPGNFQVRGPMGLASTTNGVLVAWGDSRNAVGETQAEDIYATRVRFGDVMSPTAPERSPTAWALVGGGIGLALAGLALLVATKAHTTATASP
ncbi:MAG: glycoside hydrolase [Actinomycetota bacterium]|nr:glycoside hydrolase [Actinomycetota bacterium]